MLAMRVVRAGFLVIALLGLPALAAEEKKDARGEWWWDEAWWSAGRLDEVKNYPVETRRTSYKNGDVEVPVFIARPKGRDKFLPVLFVHGRRGIDELNQLHAIRLAARGFVVFAPDLYSGRFIDQFPNEHDYQLEDDLNRAVEALLAQPDIKGKTFCSVGISRGGYYTLKLAVAKKRQGREMACYVGYYPTMQDPNAPEPMQVYQYAPEVEDFALPALVFVGEQEQYHRKRTIDSAVDTLAKKGRAVTYIVYPGVGRGFDFRPENVRTHADDLAARDAVQRTAAFIRKHLEK